MSNNVKKMQTDSDVKRKAVKLVIVHLKKKASEDFIGKERLQEWILDTEKLLEKTEFIFAEYIQLRKNLNDVIESIPDEEMRYKVRDSWYSLGKALDRKIEKK